MEKMPVILSYPRRLLSYLLSALLAFQPVVPALAATLTPQGATGVDKAANGVPVVNIARPNGAGISHNQFKDYNVGKEGLILNNATDRLTQTQLGGLIQNNPQLQAGKEARAIINEVNGGGRSHLNGYTEVAGKAANVMVANPYGITCNGCGFINTPQATLTTGKPVLDAQGNLQSITVSQGSITIEGSGLDASQSDALSLISRATEVNAAIYAKDLTVITGANKVDAQGNISATTGSGNSPQVAIDTGALGGMYANRIRLVSGEKGVGVNLGNLNARAGDIRLDANGMLTLNNSLASGNTAINAQNIALTGNHKAGGALRANSQQDLTTTNGTLNSDGDLQLSAGGLLAAGNSLAKGSSTLSGQNIKLTGRHTAGGDLTVTGRGNVALNNATLTGNNNINLSAAGSLTQQTTSAVAGNNLALSAGNLNQDATSQSDAARDITVSTTGTTTMAGRVTAGQGLRINSGALNNSGQLNAGGAASVAAGNISQTGTLQGNGVTITGNQLTNSGRLSSTSALNISTKTLANSGDINAKGNLRASASTSLNNSGQAVSDGALALSAGTLNNTGTLSGGRGLTATASALNTGANSVTHSDDKLTLNADTIELGGETSADGNLTLSANKLLSTLNNAQVQSNASLALSALTLSLAGTQAAKSNLMVNATQSLAHSGNSAGNSVQVTAPVLTNSGAIEGHLLAFNSNELTNSGAISGQDLAIQSTALINGGLLEGSQNLDLATTQLHNQQSGLISGGARLELTAAQIINAGVMATDASLRLQGSSLNNQGEISASDLQLDYQQLTNAASGLLLATGSQAVKAQRLDNQGKIAANALTVDATQLNHSGLLQGNQRLDISGTTLTFTNASRTLSGKDLSLNTSALTSGGTIQGQSVNLNADSWNNTGSLLAMGNLNATAAEVNNQGELLTHGNTVLSATTLTNRGDILSEGDLTLTSHTAINSGNLQGATLSARQDSFNNQGSVIGLQALNLASRLEMAAPLLTLVNSQQGSLLTAGDLNIAAGQVNNAGQWQGQRVLLSAQSLAHSGTIQSADALQIALTGKLDASASGKISANGSAAITALEVINNGQWIAKNLTLKASSLDNRGEVTGVDGLEVAVTGALSQQQNGQLLSAGRLNLAADSISNAGQVQGNSVTTRSGTLNNSGKILGQQSLDINVSGTLNNTGSGTLLSQDLMALTLNTLENQGLIQGNGISTLSAKTSLTNGGKIVSGAGLTLNTPEITNSGWLQATQLVLNAAKATNSGTWLGSDSARFSGEQLTNTGTLQGNTLAVNYRNLNNSGTLLGNGTLDITTDNLSQQASGALYSAGNLILTTPGLALQGKIVALGDVTLNLVSTLTNSGTLAAGKTLAVTTQGSIANQSVMQGNAVNLSAGNALTNQGTITTGQGSSTLSASTITLDSSGSLQAGGDLTLNSRSDITVAGFTGTAGALTLNATGSLLNTALLYAAGNMRLFADNIQNLKGDILAGGSLWLQKDAAGNANREIVNSSGNIETQLGDITINTRHLLNEMADVEIVESQSNALEQYSWLKPSEAYIPLDYFQNGQLGGYEDEQVSGNDGVASYYIYYALPKAGMGNEEFAISSSSTSLTASGEAARIVSGQDLYITADTLDNKVSVLLANRNAVLSGNTLNNLSVQTGTINQYQTYKYSGISKNGRLIFGSWAPNASTNKIRWGNLSNDSLYYIATGDIREEQSDDGQLYRGVIQAGNNLTATFNNNIGNSTLSPHTPGFSNAIMTPSLNTLSQQNIGTGASGQQLGNAGLVEINSPQWQDQLSNALQGIAGGSTLTQQNGQGGNTSAWPLPSGSNGYFVVADSPDSPYLITINPKLNGLGQLDQSLFGDLYQLLGMKPGQAPIETNSQYTDQNQFLGSSYFLDRLGLNPDYNYRFLGDAAFDTRYVSNYILNQTGSRYINGTGSDLEQMQKLIDNAAQASQALDLQFGTSLTAAQIAALDNSILWWESASINGQTVMVPKVYLSPKDVTLNQGGAISGNNTILSAGSLTNQGSTVRADNNLLVNSQSTINNLQGGLLAAGNNLQLDALGDINNISATISGKTVALESVGGSIRNQTQSSQYSMAGSRYKGASELVYTTTGPEAGIHASDSLNLDAGKDIQITGAAMTAGGDMSLRAGDDITVGTNEITQSFSSWAKHQGSRSESDTSHQGSELTAGGNLSMEAGRNVDITGSALNAGQSAELIAGNNLALNAAANSQTAQINSSETHSSDITRTTVSAGDSTTLNAGQDINAQAAGLAAGGDMAIQAGRDVNLQAATSTTGDSYRSKKHTVINESVRQQGTEIVSGGNTQITAGRDITAAAAQVTAQQDISVAAGRDVTLTTATESDYHYEEKIKKKSGFLSSKTTHTINESGATREAGSLLSGDNVSVSAGNNLAVIGSAVAGDDQVNLNAGNNLEISAATNTDTLWQYKQTKKSGLMSSGGLGLTIGSSKTTHELRENGTTQSESFSTIGSTAGSVSLNAGGQAHIAGADVVAGKDINITGDSVVIEPGHDKRTREEKFEQKTSGLTLALSGAAGSAINSAVDTVKQAKGESDSRLAILQGTKAVLSGTQAAQAGTLAAIQKDPGSAFGVSASLGTSKSAYSQKQVSDTVTGSTLTAGNNLNISATGTGNAASSGDIAIGGSQLKAGGDTTLNAERDILLTGAANTQQLTGKNSSSSAAIGAAITAGSNTGLSVFANASAGKGSERGTGTQWSETTIDSGNNVSLTSGRDTTLTGALVSGDKISASVGRDLLLSSQQDSDRYDSKQQNVSAGGSATIIGIPNGSGYISASKNKITSNYDSVQEQTGLYAGAGGYDIKTSGHTQLNGAVIASQADKDKNRLETGTLGFSDIHNKADFTTSHAGASLSGGGSVGSDFTGNMAGGTLSTLNHSGHASGTTQAAVSDGTIVIKDKARQTQDVAALSRDPANASDTISPIFDKKKEQNRLKQAQMIGEIGGQVVDVVKTQGETEALKKAQAAYPELSIDALKNSDVYQAEMQKYGTGSSIQRATQAVTAALQGLAGGNIAQALAGASAPELANLLKSTESNPAVNTLSHAVLGAIVAQVSGNSALAGAAGAASGELMAHFIASELYGADTPDKIAKLSEEQKQTVSALATVAAGLAGGISGDSSSGAVAGAQAGKNAVENNALGDGWNSLLPSGTADYGQSVQSYVKYAQDNNLPPEQVQAGLAQMVKGDLPESADIINAILSNNPGSDTVMALLSAEDAKDYALALLTSIPAEKALTLVGKAVNVIDNKILISAAEKISTAKPGKQFTAPRDLNEQVLWNQVKENPANGKKFSDMGMNLNTDPRFPYSAGFEKMTASHRLPNGSNIEIHYQYNSITGKAYDMKIVTPQRATSNPSDVIDSIKGKIK